MAEEDPNTRGPGFQNPGAGTPAGDHYLFVIAIDKYSHKFASYRDLNNPINDAVRFMDVLHRRYTFERDDPAPQDLRKTDPERYKDAKQTIPIYNGFKTKTLYNEEANWENIKAHFNRLFEQPGGHEHDNLIVYFAGHGEIEEGGKGKIVLHRKLEDDDRKIPYENFCYDKLDNYLVNKQFRHVLFIFDCCYAGSFNLGTTGNMEKETFTRYALSSCSLDQTAADALKSSPGGSPFSIALCNLLDDKGGNPFGIEAIKIKLEAALAKGTQNKQSLKFAPMAAKMCGQGAFKFVLQNEIKSRWTIKVLSDSIIDDLGFDGIKGIVRDNYKPAKSKINIFSACSKDAQIHKILVKVLFRAVTKKEQGLGKGLDMTKSETLTYEENIWKTLLRHKEPNITENEEIDESTKEDIVNWLIGRLLNDASNAPSLTFVLSGPTNMIAEEILQWLNDFTRRFFDRIKTMEEEEKQLSKLVFYFQETKPKINVNVFFGENVEKMANIVITPPAKNLDFQSLKYWVSTLPEELSPVVVGETDTDEQVCNLFKKKNLLPPDFDHALDELEHYKYTNIIFEAFQIEKEKSIEIINDLYS